ncbi:MAG TPA: lactate utilization protein [Anaerolineales bacterium]|nr:lactate utilization protein [Anaerolineales bacterium]
MMDYDTLPAQERVQRTLDSVNARGIRAELRETKEAALERVQALIPPGCVVMTGGSVTLQQIGFEEILISGNHPWRNFKADLLAEKDPVKQSAMRREGTLAEFFLGSVNALAETGELVFASGSGSQLPGYAYTSRNVIWVVGAQKIASTLDESLRRVREYVLPLEDQRQKSLGNKAGSRINRILIIEGEPAYLRRNLTLILVNEILGF